MVFAKIDKKKFTYIESSYNEAISINLPDGEYLLVYNDCYDIYLDLKQGNILLIFVLLIFVK